MLTFQEERGWSFYQLGIPIDDVIRRQVPQLCQGPPMRHIVSIGEDQLYQDVVKNGLSVPLLSMLLFIKHFKVVPPALPFVTVNNPGRITCVNDGQLTFTTQAFVNQIDVKLPNYTRTLVLKVCSYP